MCEPVFSHLEIGLLERLLKSVSLLNVKIIFFLIKVLLLKYFISPETVSYFSDPYVHAGSTEVSFQG